MPTTPPEPGRPSAPAPRAAQSRKRYETPRLTDFGPVSKLTQGGGFTANDGGGMKQSGQCL
jgi:hypothetical protein